MAYSNAVFHIDFVNGSDAARTALTGCVASNPSGSITRINKTAHGLVTGAVVTLSAFTAWLNGAWKITVVDADNFDLDTAVWQATADPNGTVTPRGGADWADAWLTINTGATSARHQAGDEIRIAKTPDDASAGQDATWTNLSADVTLTTAVTKTINDAISAATSGWTAVTNITLGTNASRKIGATALTLTPVAAFTTGKMAYATVDGGGTQDFSAFTKISFFYRSVGVVVIAANTFRICLCSDATGDVVVDALNIPAKPVNTGVWNRIVIDNGGPLGANIQSIAIYAIIDPGTTAISINNIVASNDITHLSLIGKTGDVNYHIQSFSGTTIRLDNASSVLAARGYSGSTSTETLYYNNTNILFNANAVWQTIQRVGDASNPPILYSGGWNTSSNIRDGYTIITSIPEGIGSTLQMVAFTKAANFKFFGFATILLLGIWSEHENCFYLGGFAATTATVGFVLKMTDCKFVNNAQGPTFSGSLMRFLRCEWINTQGIGITLNNSAELHSCVITNSSGVEMSVVGVLSRGQGSVLLRKTIVGDGTSGEFQFGAQSVAVVWCKDHQNIAGNNVGISDSSFIEWQTAVAQGSDPGAWKVNVTSANRGRYKPMDLQLAQFGVAAGSLVTFKCWVKKDHATNVGASIIVEGSDFTLAGISETETLKTDDTNWEELVLTFTPTESGVVTITGLTWHSGGNSNAYFGKTTTIQT